MICKKCGSYVRDDAYTCEKCGTYQDLDSFRLSNTGSIQGMRQGRSSAQNMTLPPRGGSQVRHYDDYEPIEGQPHTGNTGRTASYSSASRPEARRGVPMRSGRKAPNIRHQNQRSSSVHRSHTNWALITCILILVASLGGVGYLIYMNQSDEGHRITARKLVLEATQEQFDLAVSTDPLLLEPREELLKEWGSIPTTAIWYVGEEYLDTGDLSTAVTAFTLADIMDPENYEGLLLKASAYEMMGNDAAAEATYLNLTEVSSFRTEAYTALIRIYQAQERRPEAAEMMRLAYENTDRENFRLQREEYIPEMPQVNLASGRYQIDTMEENILLTSPQGYDVYYTTDDEAVLPQDGLLAEDGVIIPVEGTIKLRAVCVSGDLVSDPFSASYTFFYPTPPAPKCNLAPNTYKSLRTVELRPGKVEGLTKKEQAEMEAQLVYYYTIDGSIPTEESPRYDGTPIQLPSGRVTLRAICVNQYGKMSSTLEVGYKFEVKPYPLNMYGIKDSKVDFSEDSFAGFTLNQTNQVDFEATFGKPNSVTETTYLNQQGVARHLDYPWGYAVFLLSGNQWQLVRVEMRSGFTSTPRGIQLGASASEVMAAYKDFGQLPNADGSRGLYYDYPNVGQYLIADDGTEYIQYTAYTLESKMWVLQYWLEGGHVKRITHYWQP